MNHRPETNESLILRVKDAADDAPWSAFRAVYRPVGYRLARIRGLQDADADGVPCGMTSLNELCVSNSASSEPPAAR